MTKTCFFILWIAQPRLCRSSSLPASSSSLLPCDLVTPLTAVLLGVLSVLKILVVVLRLRDMFRVAFDSSYYLCPAHAKSWQLRQHFVVVAQSSASVVKLVGLCHNNSRSLLVARIEHPIQPLVTDVVTLWMLMIQYDGTR